MIAKKKSYLHLISSPSIFTLEDKIKAIIFPNIISNNISHYKANYFSH